MINIKDGGVRGRCQSVFGRSKIGGCTTTGGHLPLSQRVREREDKLEGQGSDFQDSIFVISKSVINKSPPPPTFPRRSIYSPSHAYTHSRPHSHHSLACDGNSAGETQRGMAISDAVVANLTTIYLAAIAAIKAYGLATGRSFSGGFVLVTSTAAVVLILIGTLAWDVSRKATYALSRDHVHEMCRGGICWHGVAVKSSASQVRFRLPQQPPNLRL